MWRNWTYDELGPRWQYVAPGGSGRRATPSSSPRRTACGSPRTTGDLARRDGQNGLPSKYLLSLDVTSVPGSSPTVRVTHLRGASASRDGGRTWEHDPGVPLRSAGQVAALRYRSSGSAGGAEIALILVPASDRPRRRSVPRPDIHIRVDDGRKFPAASGSGVQQPGGRRFTRSEMVWSPSPVRRRRAPTRSRSFMTGCSATAGLVHLPIRPDGKGGATSRGGGCDRARRQYRARHERSPAPRDPHDTRRRRRPRRGPAVRYPPYAESAALDRAAPGHGAIAGRVLGSSGEPVPGARVYGVVKRNPRKLRSRSRKRTKTAPTGPVFDENFAIGDVPAGEWVLGVEIEGKRVYRKVRVEPGQRDRGRPQP